MRFMMMHKVTEEMEKGLPPDQETLAGIGALMEDAAKAKVMLSGEGLKPTSFRTHITYARGVRTVTEGPFTDAKELPTGFAILRVREKAEALAWGDELAAALGDVSLHMGEICEPWDLGFAPRPVDAPIRYLAMHQADARSEAGLGPDPACMARMAALIERMQAAGVLDTTGALASTKKGARIRFKAGGHTVTDGPFTESKELIAGYAIFELPSKAEAIEWATRFGHVVKVNEIDVREML